jgi:hypothetical protein
MLLTIFYCVGIFGCYRDEQRSDARLILLQMILHWAAQDLITIVVQERTCEVTSASYQDIYNDIYCHTRFFRRNRMHLICVPGSEFHTYDRLMSLISLNNAQNIQEKIY